jgi:hypothetical protein
LDRSAFLMFLYPGFRVLFRSQVTLKSFNDCLLAMTCDEQERTEILKEINVLCNMHEKLTQSSECREFNRCAALLLQRLEDSGCNRLADRAMDLLASCNPKDLSQCDSVQRAKDILEKLRELASENLEKEKD